MKKGNDAMATKDRDGVLGSIDSGAKAENKQFDSEPKEKASIAHFVVSTANIILQSGLK